MSDGPNRNGFWRAGIVIWVVMLILTGTYLRGREIYSTDTDWFVFLRLGVFGGGVVLTAAAFRERFTGGAATRILAVYLATLLASFLATTSHRIVLGYLLLTIGGVGVTACLVQRCRSREDFLTLERVWLVVMLLILLKDVLLFMSVSEEAEGIEAQRLGRDISSPALMGLYAALAFWLASSRDVVRRWFVRWPSMVFLLYVVVASRTRVIISSFLAAAGIRFWLSCRNAVVKWLLVPSAFAIAVSVTVVSLGSDSDSTSGVAAWFNREQDAESLKTLSGRLDIWNSAVTMVGKDMRTLVFGYGYGATRYYLNWQDGSPEFYASHCHNAFVEHLFSTGILGAVAFMVIILVSFRWLTRFQENAEAYSEGLALRAVGVIVTLVLSCLTEVPLGGRINPAALLFFFYLLALDHAPASEEIPALSDEVLDEVPV